MQIFKKTWAAFRPFFTSGVSHRNEAGTAKDYAHYSRAQTVHLYKHFRDLNTI